MNKQFILTLTVCNESDAMISLNAPTETIRANDLLQLSLQFTMLITRISRNLYDEELSDFRFSKSKGVKDDIPF